ncbi:sensor histidine kinase [Curtobacterium sp. RRHDQ10]|uniref:sensor histidine kinase n=1 Tax=Curtobacterium phyllosphaerae TaxID=3413379 RepID=UPI003BF14E2D
MRSDAGARATTSSVLRTVDERAERLTDQLLRRVRRIRLSGLVADLLFAAVAAADAFVGYQYTDAWSLIGAVLAVLAMFLRRRWPFVAWVLTLPGLWTGSAVVGSVIALGTLASVSRRSWLIALASLGEFIAYAGYTFVASSLDTVVINVLYGALLTVGPVAIGLLHQARVRLAERLGEVEELRRTEQRQAAVVTLARERAILAREMHDVVSHQVTLIAVQAGAMQVASEDEVTRGFARTVRGLCVTTLQELREMVQVLRAAGGDARSFEPQPTLDDLDAMIVASELDVDVDVALPEDLPQPIQRAFYRFVQEALTNARKHASGAAVRIRSRSDAETVTLTVENDSGTVLDLPGSGLGLVGLAERAALLGGRMRSGPTDDGGYAVSIELPH